MQFLKLWQCHFQIVSFQTYKPAFGYVIAKPTFGYDIAKPTFGYVIAKPTFGYVIAKPTFGYVIAKPTFGYDIAKVGLSSFGNVFSKPFLAGARSCGRAFLRARAFSKALEMSFPNLFLRARVFASARAFAKLWKRHFQNYLQKFLTNKNKTNKRQSHF